MPVKRTNQRNTPRPAPQVQTRPVNEVSETFTYVRDTRNYHVFEDKTKNLSTGAVYFSKEALGETAPAVVTVTVTY